MPLMHAVEALYAELAQARKSSDIALAKIPLSLKPLVEKLQELERQLSELYIAQASKNMPVAIGDEGQPSVADILDNTLPSHKRAVDAQIKIKARPLLSRHHPDKGGDAGKFHLVKQAVKDGDMEFIHMCLHKEGFYTETSLQVLLERLGSRLSQIRSHPSFRLAQLYFSGSPEFEPTLEKLLNERIRSLQLQVLGHP
jgi:hypothetical protein